MATITDEPTSTASPAPAKPRHLWRKLALGAFVLLLLAVWFAPAVIAKTSLKDRIAHKALGKLNGTVTIGSASLGWFSTVEMHDVAVIDRQGNTIATARTMTCSKSLLSLARNSDDTGTITIDGLVLRVTSDKQTTNLEELIRPYLSASGEPESPHRPALSIRITNGTINLHDGDKQFDHELTALTAAIDIAADPSAPIKASFSVASGTSGTLAADLSIGAGDQVKLTAVNFPLNPFASALRRIAPTADLSGTLTADVALDLGKDAAGASTLHAAGNISTRSLVVAGPWIPKDRFALAVLDMPFQISTHGGTVHVDRLSLACDAGKLSAAGTFKPEGSVDQLVDTAGVKVDADIDMARVAGLLPNLLRIRAGTEIKEGGVKLHLESAAGPSGTVWSGMVSTTALKAARDGREFTWEQPLSIEFAGHLPPGHLPIFDKFVCRSDFIALNAAGSAESFRAAANISLDKLAEHLSQFVDFAGHKISGEGQVKIIASRAADGAFKADGSVALGNFTFTDRAGKGLTEPKLSVAFSTAGKLSPGAVRLDTGSVDLKVGDDGCEFALLEPIANAKQPTTGKVSAKLSGDLGRWRTRIGEFAPIPERYLFGGNAAIAGTVQFEPGKIVVDPLTIAIDNARFKGAGLDLNEPTLTARGSVTVDRAAGSASVAGLDVASAVLTVTGGKLSFIPQAGGDMAIAGEGPAIADLNRLTRTLHLQSDPAGRDAFAGKATGPVRFATLGGITTFGGTLDVIDLSYGPPTSGFSERTLKIVLDARYDLAADALTFARARVERPGFTCDATGSIARATSVQDISLKGIIGYNWDLLTPELKKSLGSDFAATGTGEKPFSFVGRLGVDPTSPPRDSAGEGGMGWRSIHASGFDVGPGEMIGKLDRGILTFTPLAATFGGGKVNIAPTVHLNPSPGELTLAQGLIVDHTKLTPKACASAVGYALPVVANASQAEGELSFTLGDNHIPLGDFTRTAASGKLIVHRATVTAGPVVSEIAHLLGGKTTSITLANEMTVPIKVEKGRVYHENLMLTINGFIVKTTGSVGFDGTLQMVVEMPVPASILSHNPQLAKALNGKSIQVPMAGTMAKPVLDRRAFEAEVANLSRDALKSAGKDLFKKELEGLIPGGLKK